jgi:hypothetical protein
MNATIDPHRFFQEIYAEQELPVPFVFKVADKNNRQPRFRSRESRGNFAVRRARSAINQLVSPD